MIAVYCHEGQHHYCSISGCTCACHDEYQPRMTWNEWNAANPSRAVHVPMTCTEPLCGNPTRARGLCDAHYAAWLRTQGA